MSAVYRSFEDRLAAAKHKSATVEFKFVNLAELVADSREVCSEARLLAIPSAHWTPDAFAEASTEFLKAAGLRVAVWDRNLPPLGPDVSFKYPSYREVQGRVDDGETLKVVTVEEGSRVIGYGIAKVLATSSEIEILDVDYVSTRSSGLSRTLTVHGQDFSVGVAHVLAKTLLAVIPRPVDVDATSESSRYICMSLGFSRRPGTTNPCLMHLR
jgi:hypothetical protein